MFSFSIPNILRRRSQLVAELAQARKQIAELQEKIETDPLLNILNRRGLERALRRTIDLVERYRAQAAVIVFDIDNFKAVNDWYGHLAGDRVLQAVSGLLASKVRSSDVVARWGGDEFVLILWQANDASADAKASVLESAVACLRVPFSDRTLSVTASAGVTILRPEDTPIKAMGRADLDMMLRKKARKQLDVSAPPGAANTAQLRVA
jgi:diguanylate cyclase (GGDEF)-like protein